MLIVARSGGERCTVRFRNTIRIQASYCIPKSAQTRTTWSNNSKTSSFFGLLHMPCVVIRKRLLILPEHIFHVCLSISVRIVTSFLAGRRDSTDERLFFSSHKHRRPCQLSCDDGQRAKEVQFALQLQLPHSSPTSNQLPAKQCHHQ